MPALPNWLNSRFQAYIFVIVAMMIWGIATPVIKVTVGYIPPMTFLMLRFWLVSLILLPFFIHYIKKYKFNINRKKILLISALLGPVLSLSLIFLGLERTSAIEGSLIITISPLMTTLFAFLILKEIISKHEITGLLIAFIGTLMIIFEPIFRNHQQIEFVKIAFIGNLLVFLALIFDSLYSIHVKKYITQDKIISSFMHITMVFMIATVAYTFLGIGEQYKYYNKDSYYSLRVCSKDDLTKGINTENYSCNEKGCYERSLEFKNKNTPYYSCKITDNTFMNYFLTNIEGYLSGKAIWGVVYMALFSGILAYALFNRSLKIMDVSETSVFVYLQPIFGIPIAIILLKEQVSIVFIIGAILTGIGIFVAEKKSKRARVIISKYKS